MSNAAAAASYRSAVARDHGPSGVGPDGIPYGLRSLADCVGYALPASTQLRCNTLITILEIRPNHASVSELAHGLVGVCGVLLPTCDALDAGIYAAEGDEVNAGISLAGVVPGAKEALRSGRFIDEFAGGRKAIGPAGNPGAFPEVTFDPRQLQSKFAKHANAFGISGNYNPSNAKRFANALRAHISGGDTRRSQEHFAAAHKRLSTQR